MFFAIADAKDTKSEPSSKHGSPSCRRFEFPEIQLATRDFDESLVIGSGGFGKVYKGELICESGPVIAAIKRLDSVSNQGATEFLTEVEMLSKLRHSNLVSLIGYCIYGKEMILVYEYMPNGSLEYHLHELGTTLSWLQRLSICLGAARGLDYLHTGTGIEPGVIHHDVKSSNILLHGSWNAKISDFGLSTSRPSNQPLTSGDTLIKGTFGYVDPYYISTGRLTIKSDVYAFGVVLLEALCRKRAVDTTLDEEQCSLAGWAQESIKKGTLKHIIDSDLRGQISRRCLKEFVRTVKRCLHKMPRERCTMREVVLSLEHLLTLQGKFNDSFQSASRRIFGRILDVIDFPSNAVFSKFTKTLRKGGSKTLHKGGNSAEREVLADFKVKGLKKFKFADLVRATNNFNEDWLLGGGGFGKVTLGWVDENTFAPSTPGVGIAVAVKRLLRGSSQGREQWQTEVSMLGRLSQPNIVSLLGYCIDEKDEYLLVYEYMQNRSLDNHLYPDVAAEPLSWGTRLRIMIGVARGLSYLHISNVIHRDVKPATILLDQGFNAKLGDFGMARSGPEIGDTHVTTRVMGTLGYLDQAYLATGHLSVKTDIYSFGVVLLETLTGLKAFDMNRLDDEQVMLVKWLSPILGHKEELKKIIDPRLEKNYPEEGVLEYAKLALRCLADQPKDRPSSEEVLQCLKQIYAVTK